MNLASIDTVNGDACCQPCSVEPVVCSTEVNS